MSETQKPQLMFIPLAKLIESPWNPRKHFDPLKQQTLVESLKTHGQLTPGTVRPVGSGKFEIAAGHRRFRALKAAGLTIFEAKVRELTDAEVIEVLTIENDERDDVHPLEQAEGFRLLMTKGGYDVAKIAQRIQRGHDFVYDRLQLLQLVPELKMLFLADRFSLSHAIVLAKLSDDEQRRASAAPKGYNNREGGGLWRAHGATLDATIFPLVANTVAELEAWIASHLRFDVEQVVVEELFPRTAELLDAAAETGAKVVAITYDDYLALSIERTDEKIYTAKFWKRADGEDGSKVCDSAVVGIIKAGKGRGAAMGVCVNRDRCTVHWAAHVKARLAREKAKKNGTPAAPTARGLPPKNAKRERAALLKRNREHSHLIAAAALIERALEAVAEAPTPAQVQHARDVMSGEMSRAGEPLRTVEQLVVECAIDASTERSIAWGLQQQRKRTLEELSAWGVDAAQLIASVQVETCTYCGCSEQNACRLGQYGGGPACSWASTTPRVCSNPVCLAQWKGEPVPAVVADEADAEDDDDNE